ncbi:MAG: hypothetical protein DM484_03235 [Candidatus Methylumidiphilus alinenensis]|uniref:Uncharacterized protein n=1 Tax=Candidatus Methylumidiphilus alinenensis TaxID=2202197 RepID=A0A2W4RJN7_9GAMM|nr:MAG: hypothetical protein DM484_03235 [Candidatus Methylumidiphilus alinenensis]
MLIVYVIALLLALLAYSLLPTIPFGWRLGIAISLFSIISILATVWIAKIGDKAPPGSITVIPIPDIQPPKNTPTQH